MIAWCFWGGKFFSKLLFRQSGSNSIIIRLFSASFNRPIRWIIHWIGEMHKDSLCFYSLSSTHHLIIIKGSRFFLHFSFLLLYLFWFLFACAVLLNFDHVSNYLQIFTHSLQREKETDSHRERRRSKKIEFPNSHTTLDQNDDGNKIEFRNFWNAQICIKNVSLFFDKHSQSV